MSGRSSTTRTVFLIVGSLAVLLGLGMGTAGGVLVWAHTTQRDSAGFYSTSAERLDTPTYALTSEEADLGGDPRDYRWIGGDGPVSVRLEVTPATDRPVFVGIGPSDEVARYLDGTAHTVVTDFEVDPFRPDIRQSSGSTAPVPPTAEPIWAASVIGSGTQTVTWPAQSGNWTVVVMNADGSPGVAVDVSVGAKTNLLLPVGIGLSVLAVVALAGGVAFLVAGLAGSRSRLAPTVPVERVPVHSA